MELYSVICFLLRFFIEGWLNSIGHVSLYITLFISGICFYDDKMKYYIILYIIN